MNIYFCSVQLARMPIRCCHSWENLPEFESGILQKNSDLFDHKVDLKRVLTDISRRVEIVWSYMGNSSRNYWLENICLPRDEMYRSQVFFWLRSLIVTGQISVIFLSTTKARMAAWLKFKIEQTTFYSHFGWNLQEFSANQSNSLTTYLNARCSNSQTLRLTIFQIFSTRNNTMEKYFFVFIMFILKETSAICGW